MGFTGVDLFGEINRQVTGAVEVKVAAVLVTYNRKELLVEALTALRAQTRPADTVIVVDNASTDGTADLLRERFAEVELLERTRNLAGGGGARRRRGQARGGAAARAALPLQRRRAPDRDIRLGRCGSGPSLLLRGPQQGLAVHPQPRPGPGGTAALRRFHGAQVDPHVRALRRPGHAPPGTAAWPHRGGTDRTPADRRRPRTGPLKAAPLVESWRFP